MKTIDDYLRKISLRRKTAAVVGPNFHLEDDPSPLYFANRLVHQKGKLIIFDEKPHWIMESHGNINEYMQEFGIALAKGIRAVQPQIIIGDVANARQNETIDLLYDCCTFKCIVNKKAAESRDHSYIPHAKKTIDSYVNMLKPSGVALLVFYKYLYDSGYSVLPDILDNKRGINWRFEPEMYTLSYELRDVDCEKVNSLGLKRSCPDWQDNSDVRIKLNKRGYVTMGDGLPEMHILRIDKQ